MPPIEVFAPAKVNLALHVTGQRADGYHLLDSLVVFADIGDSIHVDPADTLGLTIDGPEARGLSAGDDNLVLRAARLIDPDGRAAIRLTKRLPVASGIGGGSADAAATLQALARLWNRPVPDAARVLSLGADVPACLAGRALRMQGIGETILAVPGLPRLDILLVNPRVAVPTPAVFAALARRDNPPMQSLFPDWPDAHSFCDWLAAQRNDLAAPAMAMAPVISDVLARIRETDCLCAGMSGSGATCFGLYLPDGHTAKAARAHIHVERPQWWAANGALLQS